MNSTETELNRAEQAASTEVNAASAANNVDNEVVMAGEDDTDTLGDDDLIDYINEEEAAAAAEKAAARVALREMLTKNGFTLRNLLKTEQIKAHYTSPMTKEDEMSVEDILQEIPEEDLHEVGIVQGRIFMPAAFAQKWIIPAIRVRKELKRHDRNLETAMLFSVFDQSVMDLTRPRHQLSDHNYAVRAIVACAQDANVKLIDKMRQEITASRRSQMLR
jgi:hypothetical protein